MKDNDLVLYQWQLFNDEVYNDWYIVLVPDSEDLDDIHIKQRFNTSHEALVFLEEFSDQFSQSDFSILSKDKLH